MANPGSDYHRGEMDVHAQAQTYHNVMTMTKWASLHLAVLLLFLVLWFCTSAGFLTALITAAVVAVIGVLVLRGGGGH